MESVRAPESPPRASSIGHSCCGSARLRSLGAGGRTSEARAGGQEAAEDRRNAGGRSRAARLPRPLDWCSEVLVPVEEVQCPRPALQADRRGCPCEQEEVGPDLRHFQTGRRASDSGHRPRHQREGNDQRYVPPDRCDHVGKVDEGRLGFTSTGLESSSTWPGAERLGPARLRQPPPGRQRQSGSASWGRARRY